MSSINDRLTRLYARATTRTLCTALNEVASSPGAEYTQVRTWLITELERRSAAAEQAAEALFTGDRSADQQTYARTVAHAARTDPRAT